MSDDRWPEAAVIWLVSNDLRGVRGPGALRYRLNGARGRPALDVYVESTLRRGNGRAGGAPSPDWVFELSMQAEMEA